MTEIQPAHYTQGACHSAQGDRLVFSSMVCAEGVADPSGGALAVSSGVGLNVSVAAGGAFVQGDTVANQGMYHVYNDGPVTLPIATADPTDGRVDRVVARVYDAQYAGALDEWALEVITGSPSPAPEPPAEPAGAVTLGLVNVPAGSPTVTVDDVREPYQLCTDSTPVPGAVAGRRSGAPPQNVGDASISVLQSGPVIYALGGFESGPQQGLIVPVDGVYRVAGGVRWVSNSTGSRQARVHVNGTAVIIAQEAAYGTNAPHCATEVRLNAGDEINLAGFQSSGGTLATNPNFGYNYLTASLVGRA